MLWFLDCILSWKIATNLYYRPQLWKVSDVVKLGFKISFVVCVYASYPHTVESC